MDELNKTEKRILLTGSNGFLGHKLTELILQKPGYSLCCTSQSPNRNPQQEGYRFEQVDLVDFEAIRQLVEDVKPSHIIHAAALTSVEVCESKPDLCQRLNVDASAYFANLCAEKDIHLTFLSTDFVFDGKNGPYAEDDECRPCNAYGQSKWDAERLIEASGCRAAILRTILVYGVIADANRSNIVLWAKGKLENGEAIRAVSDQWRMPTWVDDLAAACLLALEKEAQGIYHISSETLYSIRELALLVAEHWHLDKSLLGEVSAAEIGQATNRPQKTGFILEKAKRELGFSPTSFTESLYTIDQQINAFRK